MLAGRRQLEHPLAGPIGLPMLVPAFTSKGFPIISRNGEKVSSIVNVLGATQTTIRESLLVSAYDICHGYLGKSNKYFMDKVIVFIDSGGYELSAGWDSTEPKQGSYRGLEFTEKDYRKVLDSLLDRMPFIIANYDWGTRRCLIKNQITAARCLFRSYEDHGFLTTFIIKPGFGSKYIDIDKLLTHVERLRPFSCIGVVEKELGDNLLDRLVKVASLRKALIERNMDDKPIHVWGGLDPISTPLYFFAGADIFDGVSWLRYAYHNGLAICRESHCVVNNLMGLGCAGDQATAFTMSQNVAFLGKLKEALFEFVDRKGRTFRMFNKLSDGRESKLSLVFQRAFETLSTEIPYLLGD